MTNIRDQAKEIYERTGNAAEVSRITGANPATVRTWVSRGGWGATPKAEPSKGLKFVGGSIAPRAEVWPEEARPLPPMVRTYIESGAAEGERNDTIFRVAQQFYACGYSQSEAEGWIMPRATAQGGERVRGEVLGCIKSAYRSTSVKEPITLNRPKVQATESDIVKPISGKLGFLDALKAAFRPGESVAVVESRLNEAGEWKPSVATIKTLEDWSKWFGKMQDINRLFQSQIGGAFIGINPLKPGSASRSNDNVAVFRHVLVEWDDSGLSLAEQAAKIEASGLPVSVMLTSGGRSVHAWVKVDATTKEEWETRRDQLFAKFGCDTKNKDLARVSRCPGAMRGEAEQKVLAVNLGPKSWAEYEQRNEWTPESFGVFDLVQHGPDPKPEVIKGVLRRGCVMQISSGPKMRKSYTLLDLALSVQAGLPWLGMETVPGPVFYLDAENQAALIRERLPKVAAGRGIELTPALNDRLRICALRWKMAGKTRAEIIAGATRSMLAMPEPPVLAILEPLYLLLRGAKEKEAEEVTMALEDFDMICRDIGCATVFVHHFSKGSQTAKAGMDRASGSGALSRFPDAIVTLTPPDEPKKGQDRPDYAATVGMDLRWFPSKPDFPVWWKETHYEATPKTTYVVKSHREGSYADKYGDVLANMPKLKRHRDDPQQCEVSEWVASKCKLSLLEARNAFETLRKSEYDFVRSLGDGNWIGKLQDDEDIPF